MYLSRRRVFILGPSHHVRLGGCALSTATKYRTPLYDLQIDTQVYVDLEATGQFEWMNMSVDEDEHSIEMHLPYVAKVMEDYKDSYTIVPVLVGSLTPEKEAMYGRIFSRYLADPQNLFSVHSLQKSGSNGHKMTLKFLKYAQSNQCCSMSDSSVSYAAAALTFE
ncbi:Protein MEMO1 [Blattella germanica]|nr:Protein MEMO1 [Blattella germanica]